MRGLITKALNEKILRHFDVQVDRRSALPAEYRSCNPNERQIRKIIFFHPPKCGGTTVESWFCRQLGGGQQLVNSASRQVAEILDHSMADVREIILAYEVCRDNNRFISGHYYFSERVLAGKYVDFDLITILREPKARLLSLYYFNRFKEDREHFGIEMELAEWLNTAPEDKSG